MFGSILGFQIAIFLSILFTRILAKGKLELVCTGWTIFTLVMVFASPLILLQLIVIWGSYGVLSGGRGDEAPEPATRSPHKERASKRQTAQVASSPSSAAALLRTVATGSEQFQAQSEALLDNVQVRVEIQKWVLAAVETTYPAKAILNAALKQAREEDRIDQTYDTPEKRARFDNALTTIQFSMDQKEPASRVPSRVPDFRLPPRRSDPRVADGVEKGIREEQARYEQFVQDICGQLQGNTNLEKHFWVWLDKLDEPAITQNFEHYAKSQGVLRKQVIDPVPASSLPTSPDTVPAALWQGVLRPRVVKTVAKSEGVPLPSDAMIAQPTNLMRGMCVIQRISNLYHFTRIENLRTILLHGLKPVHALQSDGIPFHWNDEQRIDGHEDAISISISHPNDKLFYRWRMTNPAQDWVVLTLDRAILWDNDVAFCAHNAADRRISSVDRKSLGGVDAFQALFAEDTAAPTRATQGIAACDPTDVQAEVLVFSNIPASAIKGVVFSNDASLAQWKPMLGEIEGIVHAERTGLFGLRSVARKSGRH